MDDEYVDVYYDEILAETDLAILYEIDGEEVWVPKSVHDDEGGNVISVQFWFAEKGGLI